MGTSMASPQVAAAAVLVARANPTTSAADRIQVLKGTARRGAGGWSEALGWGILDAGAAVRAALRVDRTAPRSWTRAPRSARRTRPAGGRGGPRARVRLRWTGRDRRGHPGLVPSGVRSYDVYVRRPGRRGYTRTRRATRRRSLVLRLRRPGRYAFYVRARDRAGNREPAPRRPGAVTRVRR